MQGEQIKALRERLGLSQDELAKRVGVSERTVRRWEAEGTSPLVAKFLKTIEEEGE